jgi:hypothetical protein
MAYAAKTKVPVERSKAEVEKILRKAGATQFVSGWDEKRGMSRIQCHLDDRILQFSVLKPDPAEFEETEQGYERAPNQVRIEVEREERRRWRALVLIIKAKLEVIEAGMSSIEEEFLANVLLPNQTTMGQWAHKQLEAAYGGNVMPKLLPGGD